MQILNFNKVCKVGQPWHHSNATGYLGLVPRSSSHEYDHHCPGKTKCRRFPLTRRHLKGASPGPQVPSMQDMFIKRIPLHPFFETLFNNLLLVRKIPSRTLVLSVCPRWSGGGHSEVRTGWTCPPGCCPPIDLSSPEDVDVSPDTAIVRWVRHHRLAPR